MAGTTISVRCYRASLLAPRFAATWKHGLQHRSFSCSSPHDTGPVLDPDLPHGNHGTPSLTPATKIPHKFRNSVKTAKMHKLLREKVNGGSFPMRLIPGTSTLTIKIGQMTFCLPWHLCKQWDLLKYPPDKRQIRLTIEANNGPHEHIFASKSIESDAAARVGVLAQFRDLEPVWLTCPAPSAVAFSNALADWLDDEAMDLDKHEWGADRYPFIGIMSHLISKASWNSVFGDANERKVHASKGMAPKSKWVLKPAALKAITNLRERTLDKSRLAVIDDALRHLDQHGYLPSGLFFRPATKGEGLKIELRPDAIENFQSRVRELD